MNHLVTITALFAILAMSTVPSTSALLFSPLLLRADPWGITGRQAGESSRSETFKKPAPISQVESLSVGADFGHDDDLMRYKHELMGYVYEKSLTRGFVSNHQDQ